MIFIEGDMHENEEETLDIVDGSSLIPDTKQQLEQPFEITCEQLLFVSVIFEQMCDNIKAFAILF